MAPGIWMVAPMAIWWATRELALPSWWQATLWTAAAAFGGAWYLERRKQPVELRLSDDGFALVSARARERFQWQDVRELARAPDAWLGERRQRGVREVGTARRDRLRVALGSGDVLQLATSDNRAVLAAYATWQTNNEAPALPEGVSDHGEPSVASRASDEEA